VLVTAVALAVAIVAFVALAPVVARLRTVSGAPGEAKVGMWPLAFKMMKEHPFVGIGPGAFATTFPSYKVDPAPFTFTHLENSWLQPLVELGIPAGLLLIGSLVFTWMRAARASTRSVLDVGLLAGTAAVAAHEVVDFSMSTLGVAIPFFIALGLVARHEGSLRPRRAVAMFVFTAGSLLAAACIVYGAWRAPERDATAVRRAADPAAVRSAALSSISRHPSDYLPHAIAASRAVATGQCGEAMRWLSRAMLLNPSAPEPHLVAGRCLAAAGKTALARVEFRLGVVYGGGRDALRYAARVLPSVDDLLEVAPGTPDGLMELGEFLASDRAADAELVLRRAWEEFGEQRALVPLAGAALGAGHPEAALEAAHRRAALAPSDAQAYALAARALLTLDRAEEAIAELNRGLAAVPGSPTLLLLLGERSLAARQPAEAFRLAEAMQTRTFSDVAMREVLEAQALAAQGRLLDGIEHARAAVSAIPDGSGPLVLLARLCAEAGRFDEAIGALEKAARMGGVDPEGISLELARLRSLRDRASLGVPQDENPPR
jgi:Flp pilus assembly protein TadD